MTLHYQTLSDGEVLCHVAHEDNAERETPNAEPPPAPEETP